MHKTPIPYKCSLFNVDHDLRIRFNDKSIKIYKNQSNFMQQESLANYFSSESFNTIHHTILSKTHNVNEDKAKVRLVTSSAP